MNDQTDTWHIHQRINQYLLSAIDEAWLTDTSASKGRSVLEQFVHMHNVRLMWLKVAAAELMEGQTKIEKDVPLTKGNLSALIDQSADAIGKLLEKSFAEGKIKGFKPHPSAFLAYMISHESHHRGQIMLSLKQSGHKLDQKVSYGIWEWGSR